MRSVLKLLLIRSWHNLNVFLHVYKLSSWRRPFGLRSKSFHLRFWGSLSVFLILAYCRWVLACNVVVLYDSRLSNHWGRPIIRGTKVPRKLLRRLSYSSTTSEHKIPSNLACLVSTAFRWMHLPYLLAFEIQLMSLLQKWSHLSWRLLPWCVARYQRAVLLLPWTNILVIKRCYKLTHVLAWFTATTSSCFRRFILGFLWGIRRVLVRTLLLRANRDRLYRALSALMRELVLLKNWNGWALLLCFDYLGVFGGFPWAYS
jgi:hypothetical protein